jgi:hypothetical protein
MQNTATPDITLRNSVIRQIIQARYELDSQLPAWARRSHPIVRRHLGMYWRVMSPQVEPIAQWYLTQALLIVFTYPVPFLLTIILPIVIISGVLLPAGLAFYARIVSDIGVDASRSMVGEIENATLPLLVATPYPVRDILLAKVAGTLWRQSENISLLMNIVAMSQMPTLVLVYLNRFPPEQYGIVSQLFMVVVFASAIIRIPLELFLTACVANAVGTMTTGRSAAAATTLVIMGFYFVLINMPRLFTLSVLPQLAVDALLPLVAPLIGILLTLWLAERAIGEKL